MSKFTIVVTKNATKDINNLPPTARKQVKQKVSFYLNHTNPLMFAIKLTNTTLGDYRWRSGDYRIVFDVDNNKIIILRIQHRRKVYRK